MIPFFDIHAGHAELANEFTEAFSRVMTSGHVIMGPEVSAFEKEFATYCGAKHCIGVGNGLDALALTLRARGIGPGDTVSLMLPNVPAMVEAHFGVPFTGAVINALNIRLDALTIAFMLDHSEAKVVLTDPEFAPVITQALAMMKGARPW